MKYKFIILLLALLTGCQLFPQNNAFYPKQEKIICYGNICCYPTDKNKKMLICASSDQFSNVIFYFKVFEK